MKIASSAIFRIFANLFYERVNAELPDSSTFTWISSPLSCFCHLSWGHRTDYMCVCVCPGYEMYLRHSSYFLRSTVPQLLCDPSRPFIFWTSVMFLTDDIRQESREPNSEPGLSSQSLELHPCTVWVTAFKSRGKNLLVGYWMFAEQHISRFNCCHENELLNRR